MPHRAGAIVTEFISSIVAETQERADRIVVAAREEADPQRRRALEAAARIRECHDSLADVLVALRNDLRREADWLYADRRIMVHVQQPTRPAPTPLPALEVAPAEAVEENQEEQDHEDAQRSAAAEEVEPAETAAHARDEEPDGGHDEAIEDVQGEVVLADEADQARQLAAARFERMTDEELARAHANAVKAAEHDADSEQADFMRRLADAALQEALRRPTFAQDAPAPRLRRRLSRRRRRGESALDELRAACRRDLAG